MLAIDTHTKTTTIDTAAPHWAGGFGRSRSTGAKAMRHKSYGFFYASRFMAGGVWGSLRACRFLYPVDQPCMSSVALSLVASGGGFKTAVQELTMNTQSKVAPSAFVISEITIRQDDQGRYCLNDLHKAAGGHVKHRPSDWLKNQQTKELIAEIDKEGFSSLQTIKGTHSPGTYVCKELVYAYAMWISPSFSLKVIRAYDAMLSGSADQQEIEQLRSQLERITQNTITIDLNTPDSLQQITFKFKTEGFNHERWTMMLDDGLLIIRPMPKGTFIASSEKLAGLIGDSMGMAVEYKHLPAIIKAAANRMDATISANQNLKKGD